LLPLLRVVGGAVGLVVGGGSFTVVLGGLVALGPATAGGVVVGRGPVGAGAPLAIVVFVLGGGRVAAVARGTARGDAVDPGATA
jgi:hypothetical protein